MEDLMIKGTGNSRFLKSVANIMTLYPTYEAFAEALRDGTFPIDLNGINPSGVETMGTRLNKANLLTDDTATGMGLTAAATPNQALEKLRQLIQTAQTGVDNGVKIETGSYTGTGTYGVADKNTVQLSFTPKMFIVMHLPTENYGANLIRDTFFWIEGLSKVQVETPANSSVNSAATNYVTIEESAISWYNTNTAARQFNASDIVYHYIAIG